jgi:hypothetical protein
MSDLAAIQKKILDFRNASDGKQLHGFQIGNMNIKDPTPAVCKLRDLRDFAVKYV